MAQMNIIGAGRLGKTMAKLLSSKADIAIAGVCNQSVDSAAAAVEFIGSGNVFADVTQLSSANLVMISVADDAIASCAKAYARSYDDLSGVVAFHCSGVLSSCVLDALKAKGAYIASVHPMHSFARPEISVHSFSGSFVSCEGDEQALSILQPLLDRIGAKTITIDAKQKALYHASGVFAANAPILMINSAIECMVQSGFSPSDAKAVALTLLKNVTDNMDSVDDVATALTGPFKRGDVSTIASHLDAMPDNIAALYRATGQGLLDISELPEDKAKSILALLSTLE